MGDASSKHRLRPTAVAAIVVALGLILASCSVAVEDVAVDRSADIASITSTRQDIGEPTDDRVGDGTDETEAGEAPIDLVETGPSPGISHWHAAYVVRVCDDVLTPFDSEADPLGIHSHADGLIHIHPFFEESGYERATLALFADAMGLGLAPGELTLPQGGSWRDGDLCDGVPGRVFVDRWSGPTPQSSVVRIFDDFDQIRFEADGELYHIGFAPADSPPVVPPTWQVLPEVSNLLTDLPEPWVQVEPQSDPDSVRVWPVAEVGQAPCVEGAVPESVDEALSPSCFTPGSPIFERSEVFVSARPVRFNRQPAVEVIITPAFRQWIVETFAQLNREGSDAGLAIAVEVNGRVVTAPVVPRVPASETRMVISGGMSETTAASLAKALDG